MKKYILGGFQLLLVVISVAVLSANAKPGSGEHEVFIGYTATTNFQEIYRDFNIRRFSILMDLKKKTARVIHDDKVYLFYIDGAEFIPEQNNTVVVKLLSKRESKRAFVNIVTEGPSVDFEAFDYSERSGLGRDDAAKTRLKISSKDIPKVIDLAMEYQGDVTQSEFTFFESTSGPKLVMNTESRLVSFEDHRKRMWSFRVGEIHEETVLASYFLTLDILNKNGNRTGRTVDLEVSRRGVARFQGTQKTPVSLEEAYGYFDPSVQNDKTQLVPALEKMQKAMACENSLK